MKAEINAKELIDQVVNLKIELAEKIKELNKEKERFISRVVLMNDLMDENAALRKQNKELTARIAEFESQLTKA